MKISLILGTINRTEELKKFLESLKKQTYKNYELIVIDQNQDNSVLHLIYPYRKCLTAIKYYKVNFKGLSKARNFGVKYIDKKSKVIAFPDDDCEYPKDLLLKVSKILKTKKYDGVTGISIDKKGKISNSRFMQSETLLNYYNAHLGGISYTIFIKPKKIKDVKFDEKLGVGSETEFKSGEELDLLYRLLKKKYKILFSPMIKVYHPSKNEYNQDRMIYYSRGFGAVLRKNFQMNVRFVFLITELIILRPLGGIILNLLKLNLPKVKEYFLILKNRLLGFIRYTD